MSPSTSIYTCLLIFVSGILFPRITKIIYRRLLSQKPSSSSSTSTINEQSTIYDLRHGVLNIDTEATKMWMNMGFWRDQITDSKEPRNLARAAEAMLVEILRTAKVIGSSGTTVKKVNVLDVGFGCGDQTLALTKMDACELQSYVGITIDRKQYEFAKQRIQRQDARFKDDDNTPDSKLDKNSIIRRVFNADAAQPSTWPKDIQTSLASFVQKDSNPKTENWALGIDVMYHFAPSRQLFFNYVHKELHASIMAFDLLLPDPSQLQLTVTQKCLLRVLAALSSTPYSNFLTPSQYRAQLRAAGYADEKIEIRDISPHVFGPLVEFIGWQDQQLKAFGLGVGVFRATRWFFGWWARTGIVRGCIVVARHDDNKKD